MRWTCDEVALDTRQQMDGNTKNDIIIILNFQAYMYLQWIAVGFSWM